MRTIATRTLASVLAALLAVSCGAVKESKRPEIGQHVFLPRAPRAVASPVLEELELRRAIEELLPYVNVEEARAELRRMVADPRFHGRRPGELRVVLASWGSGPVALEEIGREYRAWCAAVRRTDCHEGPLTDSSVYEIAFDFALGSQWDGFVGEVKSTIDPSTIRIVLLTGLVIFMATIAIPELLSKIPAAAATVLLTAYLGARAVCDLVFGWIQMVRELDAAKTFNEVRAAGQRYGRLVGAQTARILILLATAAIAQGGLIARLMKLPRAAQASAALATETGGIGLEAVSAVQKVRVVQGGVAITIAGVANGAVSVAMAAHGTPPSSGTTGDKTLAKPGSKDTANAGKTTEAEVVIEGVADASHEAVQATRFARAEGGGGFRFLGNSSRGIEGFFTPKGTTQQIPVSLKDFTGTGKLRNIIQRINFNSQMVGAAGYGGRTILHARVSATVEEMAAFAQGGPLARMPGEGVFQRLIFECLDGIVEVTTSGVARR